MVFTALTLINSPTKNTLLYKIISEESAKSRTTPNFNLLLNNLITKVIPIFLPHQLSSIQNLIIKSFFKGQMRRIDTKKGVFQWNHKFRPKISLLQMQTSSIKHTIKSLILQMSKSGKISLKHLFKTMKKIKLKFKITLKKAFTIQKVQANESEQSQMRHSSVALIQKGELTHPFLKIKSRDRTV
jgi:hypothetical protein